MNNLLKMLLLVGLVVSATWAASWVTGRGPPTMVALQQGAAGQGSGSAPASPEQAPTSDVTHEEIDAAMKAVEKTLAGGGRDAGEVVAEKPLPADLAFAIPSDI